MNPDTPQSGKRAGKSGARTGGAFDNPSSFDPTPAAEQSSFGDRPMGATGDAPSSFQPTGSDVGEGRQASRLIDQVKDKATTQINEQKARATAGLGSVADAVRQTGRQLRGQQHDAVAQVVENAAAQLERFSNHLRDRNLDELVNDAQRLARQQPAIFIGSSFAAGLLAARFIKASSPGRSRASSGGGNDWRDVSGRSGESVYGATGREGDATRGSSFDRPAGSSEFATGDRPMRGDVRDNGGL
jgi:hypothetical protein